MFQVYINILIFPMGKSLWGYFPAGIFPAGIFPHWDYFLQGIHPERNVFNGKVFSAFSHIQIIYGMDPAQLLHAVVKKAGKTNSKTDFHIMLPNTCIYSKAIPVRASCLCHLFIHFAKSLDPDQALHLRPDQDPNCLSLWWYS